MKAISRFIYLAVIYGLLLTLARADELSSPYFQIVGNRDEATNEQLPLKSSAASVTIDGSIARVHPRGGAWHDAHHWWPGDRGEDAANRDFKGLAQTVKTASVPEPGSIGLVAFLVVLLALQRQRDLQA